jgi:hypothetical protein
MHYAGTVKTGTSPPRDGFTVANFTVAGIDRSVRFT